jgi:hypothetical protein
MYWFCIFLLKAVKCKAPLHLLPTYIIDKDDLDEFPVKNQI